MDLMKMPRGTDGSAAQRSAVRAVGATMRPTRSSSTPAAGRYMNEALPYVEATHHMYGGKWGQGPGPGENLPSWMILGQQWRDPCLFAGLQGGQRFPRKWVDAGVVVVADTGCRAPTPQRALHQRVPTLARQSRADERR